MYQVTLSRVDLAYGECATAMAAPVQFILVFASCRGVCHAAAKCVCLSAYPRHCLYLANL